MLDICKRCHKTLTSEARYKDSGNSTIVACGECFTKIRMQQKRPYRSDRCFTEMEQEVMFNAHH